MADFGRTSSSDASIVAHTASRAAALIAALGLAMSAIAQTPTPTQPEKPTEPAAAASAPAGRLADQTRPTRAETDADDRFTIALRPRLEYAFDGDLRDSKGKVSVARAGGGLGLSYVMNEKLIFLFNADAEFSRYDWSDIADLLPSGKDPIKDAYTFRLSPGAVYVIDDSWSLTGGAIVELAAESGASLGDGATYGGFFGARYKVSDTLNFTFGAIAKTRLEDDAIVVPLIGVNWQITDRLSLENEGLGLKFTGKINDQWRASIFARFELREFRLKDDNTIPEGILRDQRLPVGVAIEWRPTPKVSVTLSGGAMVYQKYTFDNKSGDQVESDRTRPTPFVGLSASFAF